MRIKFSAMRKSAIQVILCKRHEKEPSRAWLRDSYLKGEESDTVRDVSHSGAKLFMKWEGECFRSSTGESQPIPTLAFTSKVWGTFSTYPKVCSFSKPESKAISHGASLLFFSLLRFHFPDPFRCLFSVTPGSALQRIKLISCLGSSH